MRTLDINSDTIFLVKRRINEDGIETYGNPIELTINLNCVTSRYILANLGEYSKKVYTGVVSKDYLEDLDITIDINDRVYVHNDILLETNPELAETADFVVTSVSERINFVEISLKEIING